MAGIDEVEKLPVGQTPINRPASGTYGEKAALENLEAALPAASSSPGPMTGPAQAGPAPMSPTNPVRSSRQSNIPGVPAPVMKPSSVEPTPGGMAPPAIPNATMTGSQRRLQILDMLATSPNVSATTREWAQRVMEILVG